MNISPMGPRGERYLNVLADSLISRQMLAEVRSTQSHSLSLKKAVRLGYVRIAKVIGTDDGKGNYQVEIVKTHKLQARLA